MHLAVVGFGLIGGSLAASLRKRSPGIRISGYARSEQTRKQALALGLADEMPSSLVEAVKGADIIFVSTPVASFESIFRPWPSA